ncbi:hypothetical protein [Pseudoalteromonas sp. PPB1]|uniref:hypothetical protein n=1 Tax=Pseudoalteromonas sp. PPB1 TaxID=2756136 RepID=UPI001890F822|nr:hypothetical protein [Pseudoalteromonas sp. PPB1]
MQLKFKKSVKQLSDEQSVLPAKAALQKAGTRIDSCTAWPAYHSLPGSLAS